ncbi:MAG TPA: GyrI-like domain-containing protein [Isosphaeraceae bacterium]|jgi:effector-binding domain-containing protein|nr:GyrI-like domain-containing protein [Isosphaeraceae bacterium]
MPYQVQIQQVEPQPIAVVRRQAAIPQLSTVVPQACGEVWEFIRAAQIQGAGRHVAVYLDCQTGQLNMEIGCEVTGHIAGDGNVFSSSTPAGTVATTVHIGPYDRLGDAHNAIQKWCADNHYQIAGPQWEIYGHWTDDPSQLRTDVYYLIDTADQSATPGSV